MQHPLTTTVQKTSKHLSLIALLLALVIIAGCGTIEKDHSDSNLFEDISFGKETEADPDELPLPEESGPPSLIKKTPPSYQITRLPGKPSVTGKLNVSLKREWQYIVIHHSGTRTGDAEAFDKHHRDKLGWLGVGYHFVIGNGYGSREGEIESTFRWKEQIHGAHAGVEKYNQHGIGICLVGNFDNSYPTEKQIKALASLVSHLQEKCHIPSSQIFLHRQIKNTNCPGEHFPFYQLISLIDH